ncbi:MAG: F0F1 ATP synthase subunit epsilon [Bacteroidaceae bacterium]|nr:F0F1 ATP synthase subunit epsilon [Bacteroidaceae bacterium]
MDEELIELEIVSPEKTLFTGLVEWVTLPGAKAPFTVLYNHAPIVSTLCAGKIKWKNSKEGGEMLVNEGFVEVRSNKVVVCVEVEG